MFDGLEPAGLAIIGLVMSGLLAAFLTVPLALWLSVRTNTLDLPGELKVHDRPIPKLGGLGILVLVFAACLFVLEQDNQFWVVLVGTAVIALIGLLDDLYDWPQWTKFLIEAIVSLLVAHYWLDSSGWQLGLHVLALLTIINAYNFMDGLDGLAGGLLTINALFLGILFLRLSASASLIVLIFVTAGGCLGFLRHNWQPATIYLGDNGSLSLGFLVGLLSLKFIVLNDGALGGITAVILIALLPVADTVFTFIRRIFTRQTISLLKLLPGDRYHFYDQMRSNAKLTVHATVTQSILIAFIFAIIGITVFQASRPIIISAILLSLIALVGLAKWYKIHIPPIET